MARSRSRRSLLFVMLVVASMACGALVTCSDDDPTCVPEYGYELKDGTCAGLPTEPCTDAFCGQSSTKCSKTYHVSASSPAKGDGSKAAPFAKLADAAKAATSGDCVLVASGSYTGTTFKGGANILGTGADSTVITGAGSAWALVMKGGTGGSVRGIGISGVGNGLYIDAAEGLHVDRVRINGATGVGLYARAAKNLELVQVTVRATSNGKISDTKASGAMGFILAGGTTATITRLLAEKNAQIGLYTADSVVTMTSSALVDSGSKTDETSRGVSLTCSSVSACKALGKSTLNGVEFWRNYCVSLSVMGVNTEVSKLTVSGTKQAIDSTTTQKYSNAVQAVAFRTGSFPLKPDQYHSSKLLMTDSTVENGEGAGVVIEFSSATLNKNTIKGNSDRGIWVQRTSGTAGHSVVLNSNTVEGNKLVAIGGTGAQNVTVNGGTASTTASKRQLLGSGEQMVGDGIQALNGSSFTVDMVTLAKNDRVSVVLDASAGKVSNCILDRKDPTKDDGILAQNGSTVTAKGNKDAKGGAVPAVQTSKSKVGLDPTPIFMPPAAPAPLIK